MYFGNGSQNDDFIFNEIISGAIVDNELEFELNIKNVCKQAARKQMQPQGKTARNKAAKKKRTVRHCLETALCRAPQLWSLVPYDINSELPT